MYTNDDPQLDQELWSLFEVDTQKSLESYSSTVEKITAASWKEHIQQLYRDVHTVKGGAATVGAEVILTISKQVEDILSELRYLQEAPASLDSHLKEILIELGELLMGSLGATSVSPMILERIKALHTQVKEGCLSDWTEEKQLHQDFADQGFDLMVLDLEMAIENLGDSIPESLVELALSTLEQLLDVGNDIALGQGWRMLIQQGMELSMSPEPGVWRAQFPLHLQQLKNSARNGGKELGSPSIKPQEQSPTEPILDFFSEVPRESGNQEALFELFDEEAPLTSGGDEPILDFFSEVPRESGNQEALFELFAEEAPLTSDGDEPILDFFSEVPRESRNQEALFELFAEEAPLTSGGVSLETSLPEEEPVDPELRALFDMDTQKYLQVYFVTIEQLNPSTWKQDIQNIYRAIHTIKGGAATVGANPILAVAKVLEDWLSDLRSLEDPPPLDQSLRDSLLECGELLIATLQMGSRQHPTASVERISSLHQTFKLSYGEELSEEVLLQREFAEQGFDLVVLDLEMYVERLGADAPIDREDTLANQQVLEQLAEIGQELKLKGDWDKLIAEGMEILSHPRANLWIERIPPILRSLKEAAKHGGSVTKVPKMVPAPLAEPIDPELKALFDVDTQKYLQEYFSTVETLSAQNWQQDIQKLYRAIHTIKGGAATVGANPILHVSKVLEDWLSDLRNLETPPLLDGELRSGMLEAGEFLIGSLQLDNATVPTAAVDRIMALHGEFKQSFGAELDEQTLLHREFAEQGFDLMMLEVEMMVEQLTPDTVITPAMQETATTSLAQLAEIGTEIGLGEEWTTLLAEGHTLIAQPQAVRWMEQWMPYLQALKASARRSGKVVEPVVPQVPVAPERPKAIEPPPTAPTPDIQIPVPLERLDRSAQYLVETLMATRATQGFYQVVQQNLVPIVSLAQDSAQYISRLREVQDDFAVADTDTSRGESGVKLERYRQGYTAINRLLEITLRLMELGAETGEAARRTSDSLVRLEQSLRSLQGTVEESRLVPFESLSFRARGILRDLTTRMHKPARLYVVGEKLELDAGTLRNLEPVLLHLIRNSFDHGLEEPHDREKQGKPSQGRIDLSLTRRGSVFVLELKDDGRGIDPEKIRNIAISKGLPLQDTSTPEKILTVICQPGFTSAKTVSDISGRGVGMDVVASQVSAMGGQLSLKTKMGVGSTFTIQIPVPNLFVRCMLLQVSDRVFAVPTAEVFTTMLLDDLLWRKVPPETPSLHSLEVEEDTGFVPAIDLFQYWQGDRTQRTLLPTSIAVRTKRADSNQGVWLIADTMVGQSELLVNSLPSPLVPPIGTLGVSLMPDGKLIPVIDTLSLMGILLGAPEESISATHPGRWLEEEESLEEEGLQILVVDDAALMRRRIESVLTPNGYQVITCTDGLEAWDWLQSHRPPTVLITDIEMPNMDGFTLIDHCRQAAMTMPILVVSSRLAEEWSKETERLGATDFLTKGFGTAELLAKVASLIEQSHLKPVGV